MKRPKSGFKLGQMFGPGSKYFVFGSTKLFAVMHNYLKKGLQVVPRKLVV